MCLNDEEDDDPLQGICCWCPVLSHFSLEEINAGACLSPSRRKGARENHPLSWSLSDDENEAINLIPLTESQKGVFWVYLSIFLSPQTQRGGKSRPQVLLPWRSYIWVNPIERIYDFTGQDTLLQESEQGMEGTYDKNQDENMYWIKLFTVNL